jgi:alpha-tubulin suppressor-like RCC1 family protein
MVKSDGTVWAAGHNDPWGELGNGTTASSSLPVQAIGSGYTSVSAGDGHSVAARADGTLWTWGFSYYGQIGDGRNVNTSSPVRVGGW